MASREVIPLVKLQAGGSTYPDDQEISYLLALHRYLRISSLLYVAITLQCTKMYVAAEYP